MLSLRAAAVGLALIALGVALWLLVRMPPPTAHVSELSLSVPENRYLQVRHRIRDLQGELLYEVAAQQLDQYANSRALRLNEPRLRWLNPRYRNSSASARSGWIQDFQVTLQQDVELLLAAPGKDPVLMHSAFMVLDSKRERLHTDEAVVIGRAGAVMRGTGLEYPLDGSGGRLQRDVRVREFTRAQTPTPDLLKRIVERAFGAAHAQENSNDVLDLSAKSMEWDSVKKVSVYRGDVHATQGAMVLKADQLTVQGDVDRVRTLLAEGNAHWTQPLDSGKQLRARAGSIYYQIQERKATLKRNVDLWVGANQFKGEQLVYLLDEERIETPPAEQSSERIQLRLFPESEKDAP